MDLDKMRAQLEQARKKPEEKKPADEAVKPKPGKEQPLDEGAAGSSSECPVPEPLPAQLHEPDTEDGAEEQSEMAETDGVSAAFPSLQEEETSQQPEAVAEQPAPSEPEESEGKDMIAKITDVVATTIEKALESVEERIAELRAELDTVSGAMQEKFNEVDSDQAALSGRIGTVQATANGLEESIGTLGTDVDDVKGKTAGLEESAARTAMELKNLNEGQDELNGRVDESKATAHNMKATLGGLETKTTNVGEQTALLETAMTEKFGEVDEEMATLNSKIGIAQATADGLKGRMDTLETSWDEAKNRLNEFKTKVKAVIEALPQDLTQAEKRIAAKLAKRVTVVTGEIDAKVLKAQQTADSAQANVSTLEGAMGEAFDNADSVQAALNSKIGTAQATADGLQKQAESLEGEQSKQRDALEKATGPAYEGAEAVGELREETTKKLLVEVLRADNYTDHLKEVKGKHGPETVKALLQALTSNPEFVKETLARWHYGTGMKELRESRETPKKEWVENTAKIIVMRAQECARGDV